MSGAAREGKERQGRGRPGAFRPLVDLVPWMARRNVGVAEGDTVYGYTRGQGAMAGAWVFVCVVETVGMAVLLRSWPVVHAVMLVIDVYTVLWVLGLYAACAVRPHVLGGGVLRLRNGWGPDVCVPLELIESARAESRFSRSGDPGALELDVASQTSVTLRLSAPLPGAEDGIQTVRFHADEPRPLLAALAPQTRAGR
jgi:hypothetical protein